MKTWATTLKEDLEPPSGPRVFGFARWRKDWAKITSEFVQYRRAWGVSIRDVVTSTDNTDSTHPHLNDTTITSKPTFAAVASNVYPLP